MGKIGADDVCQAVWEVIREVQESGGHPLPQADPTLCPVTDIEGFDSLVSVEATVMLEQRLGIKLPNDTMFIKDGQPITIEQVIQRVLTATAYGGTR